MRGLLFLLELAWADGLDNNETCQMASNNLHELRKSSRFNKSLTRSLARPPKLIKSRDWALTIRNEIKFHSNSEFMNCDVFSA
jgi:hypothetical protein